MRIAGSLVVVTGAANGIGRGLVRAAVTAGARAVGLIDIDAGGMDEVSRELGDVPVLSCVADASDEDGMRDALGRVEAGLGPIDVFCANVGVAVSGDLETDDALWLKSWDLNLMSIVRAARVVVPAMRERGRGGLIITSSAAGLLGYLDGLPYGVTKTAAVALAEHLRIREARHGIQVSCLCPAGVRTAMTAHLPEDSLVWATGSPLDAEEFGRFALAEFERGEFLVVAQEKVRELDRLRLRSREEWFTAMRALGRIA
ncbi:SDR family oxidoreductase [Allokutzneria sp. A3M-2-11 16]|uniref:SDR family oxidoreductase n=1 Tax=Allokutzneria sp. A3M-2-11 16 TaxID=2962043 RepID=UPI0020B7F160|nr:SDR family NAD(P)-dependent oxidoreductase [Allokutzneria sp. A3M-2-11 16]MCP3804799.1 SDR family oxidoreductase [Allokutzneria sp. A3M-2-11 16]